METGRITRDQLVLVVKELQDSRTPDDRADELCDLLERNVPHPEPTDLIFFGDPGMTAEEIVDLAFNYQPIVIEP